MSILWFAAGIVVGVLFAIPLRPVIDRAWAWVKSLFNTLRE